MRQWCDERLPHRKHKPDVSRNLKRLKRCATHFSLKSAPHSRRTAEQQREFQRLYQRTWRAAEKEGESTKTTSIGSITKSVLQKCATVEILETE